MTVIKKEPLKDNEWIVTYANGTNEHFVIRDDQTIEEAIEGAKNASDIPPGYKELRRQAYPPIRDQLDAIWKGGGDYDEMKAIVLKVKVDYPCD